ncbi:helix-turn-helix domain-containing protein [Ancylobacter oerskovii]|uniref:Helix-turn-helix domain-containing protein n=1 Tax=Ancylobacter oerskovii TaxID=459519 RepID=A0ABW4YZG0_9HYPH|nr:XRE family transcriptional regulator [Ancylobacter oerskovii]MBS7543893.1 helix-turn-helix transcriptional regulator [Ancylobacter oerskovii]
MDMKIAEDQGIDLGGRVKGLRGRAGFTIKEVAARSGISPSAISKIENNLLSPTYDNIIRLAQGLGVDISELFSSTRKQAPHGRRSLTRAGQGDYIRTRAYTLEMLCSDLTAKRMQPMKARLRAHEAREFGTLVAHAGEEVVLVLRGQVTLLTEFYAPVTLEEGDSVYFDSTMGHALLSAGSEDAEIFWVCAADQSLTFEEAPPDSP